MHTMLNQAETITYETGIHLLLVSWGQCEGWHPPSRTGPGNTPRGPSSSTGGARPEPITLSENSAAKSGLPQHFISYDNADRSLFIFSKRNNEIFIDTCMKRTDD